MNSKQAYALGYYYGRAEGSYGLIDFDDWEDTIRHEFKLGYDSGVADSCLIDIEEITQ
jgi:hypothetical protein